MPLAASAVILVSAMYPLLAPRWLSWALLLSSIAAGLWWADWQSAPAAEPWGGMRERGAESKGPELRGVPSRAREPVRAPALPAEPPLSVSGLLTGRTLTDSGAPLPGVRIYAAFDGVARPVTEVPSVQSSPSGEYELLVPTGQRIGIIALRDGYEPLHVEDVLLAPSDSQLRKDLRLAPGSSISGRIIDLEGRPVAGALVIAEPPGADPGMRSTAVLPGAPSLARYRQVTRSGQDGGFVLAGLRAGVPLGVQVRKSGWIPAWSEVDGVTAVPPMDSVELRMEPTYVCRLEFVAGLARLPVPGVQLETLGAGNLLPSTLTDDWFDGGPSAQALRSSGRVQLYARLDRSALARSDGMTLRLVARAVGFEDRSFSARWARSEEDPPFQQVELRQIEASLARLQVRVRRVDDGPYTGPVALAIRLADGSTKSFPWLFVRGGACEELPPLPPGPTRIASLDGDTSRQVDGAIEPVDFTMGSADGQTVEAVLRDRRDRSRLIVLLEDGAEHPSPGATITIQGLRPEGGSFTLLRPEASADFSGIHRHVFSIEPGRCLVSATRRGFQRAAVTTDLVAGETKTVRLQLIAEAPR